MVWSWGGANEMCYNVGLARIYTIGYYSEWGEGGMVWHLVGDRNGSYESIQFFLVRLKTAFPTFNADNPNFQDIRTNRSSEVISTPSLTTVVVNISSSVTFSCWRKVRGVFV